MSQPDPLSDRNGELEELQNTVRRYGEFLGKLGHEIGNLVLPIRIGLDILEQTDPDRETAESVKEMLGSCVPAMLTLVDKLRTVSRLARGRIQPSLRDAPLLPVVQKAVQKVTDTLHAKDLYVNVQVPSDLNIRGDVQLLEQALLHLLDNAIRFSGPESTITIDGARQGEHIALRIQDEGAGISAELLPEVAKLFVRGEGPPDFPSGHLGVGLPFAEQVAAAHGGYFRVHSAGPGQGTEVTLGIPSAK